MAADASATPPNEERWAAEEARFRHNQRVDRNWLIVFVSVVSVIVIVGLCIWFDDTPSRLRRQRAQSDRETEACLAVGGLPHHNYASGLIERCDR